MKDMYLINIFFLTGAFKPFKCYNISVYPLYGNKIGTPHSIQAYVQEGRMYIKLSIRSNPLYYSLSCNSICVMCLRPVLLREGSSD